MLTRLHKLGVCLTHTSTMALMENIADGHDEEVLEWQDDLHVLVRVPSPDPMVRLIIIYGMISLCTIILL